MYLIDSNVISELRKKTKMNAGVKQFFDEANRKNSDLYLSVITVGELYRGVGMIRHRGDEPQAKALEQWLESLLGKYEPFILPFDLDASQVWGKLRTPHHENAIDKQIAATAILYDLILITRNTKDFSQTGARLINPFQ